MYTRMLVQVMQCKMQKCTMHMHKPTTKPRKRREEQIKPTKLTKEKSAIKRGNKPQASLASEQRCLAQEVWLGYLRFASLKGHGSSICGPLMIISQEVEPDIYVFGSRV